MTTSGTGKRVLIDSSNPAPNPPSQPAHPEPDRDRVTPAGFLMYIIGIVLLLSAIPMQVALWRWAI